MKPLAPREDRNDPMSHRFDSLPATLLAVHEHRDKRDRAAFLLHRVDGGNRGLATGGLGWYRLPSFSRQSCHINLSGIAHTDLQQRGVLVQVGTRFHHRSVGELALTLDFLDCKHVHRDRIGAEPELVQDGRIMEPCVFLA